MGLRVHAATRGVAKPRKRGESWEKGGSVANATYAAADAIEDTKIKIKKMGSGERRKRGEHRVF